MPIFSITDFQSSLLRERFLIHDQDTTRKDTEPVIAMSNRMVVSLQKSLDQEPEVFIIRTQNMHSCVRFAGRVIQSFNTGGSLLTRAEPYDWAASWEAIVQDYERSFNDDIWGAVYHRGKVIFKNGEHHAFLDLIEKCEFENEDEYDFAVPMAENTFKQSGKIVKIEYEANVALVSTFNKEEARCGVILRGADGTTTFNFRLTSRENSETKEIYDINIPQCLSVCAAFLEGIQLAFMVGMNMFKIRMGIIERSSKEEQQTKDAHRRLGRLGAEIANLENLYDVRYRPERPEFSQISSEAEELAVRVIPMPEKKPPKPFGADDASLSED